MLTFMPATVSLDTLFSRHTSLMIEAIKLGLDPTYACTLEAAELAEYIRRWKLET